MSLHLQAVPIVKLAEEVVINLNIHQSQGVRRGGLLHLLFKSVSEGSYSFEDLMF
jgi:hypothetical protein